MTVAPPAGATPPPLEYIEHPSAGITVAVDRAVVSERLVQLIASGEYERGEADIARKLVRPEDSVLELGAGLGLVATHVLKTCKPMRYVAVEADPRLIPLIARTLHANGVAAATIVNAILTNDAAKLAAVGVPFAVDPHFWASRESDGGSLLVPARSLDEMLAAHRVTVMIVDIEGSEGALFHGAALGRVRAVFVECHADRIGPEGFAGLFADLHGAGLIYDPALSYYGMLVFSRWS